MTVGELVKKLKDYPEHAVVCIEARDTEFDYISSDFEYLTKASGCAEEDTLLIEVRE